MGRAALRATAWRAVAAASTSLAALRPTRFQQNFEAAGTSALPKRLAPPPGRALAPVRLALTVAVAAALCALAVAALAARVFSII
jgi:hypothetical protein